MGNHKPEPDQQSLILVDAKDRIIGHSSHLECHSGQGRRHRAVSIFVFNSGGEILLQQRNASKMLWPLTWSTSCCGHPLRGESYTEAAYRRLKQELGLSIPLRPLFTFSYIAHDKPRGTEREICKVYFGTSKATPIVNANEVADWKFVLPADLSSNLSLEPSIFTPWLHLQWDLITSNHRDKIEIEHPFSENRK